MVQDIKTLTNTNTNRNTKQDKPANTYLNFKPTQQITQTKMKTTQQPTNPYH